MKRVLDVFHRAQLAGPAAARQLAGSVLRHSVESEQCHFLETGFKEIVVADGVAKGAERIAEGLDRLCPSKRSSPAANAMQLYRWFLGLVI
jgi:hypothetical protein